MQQTISQNRTKYMLFMEHEVESELNSGVTDAQCSMKFVIDIQPFYPLAIALQSHNSEWK